LEAFKKAGYITGASSTWYFNLPVESYGDEVKNIANVRMDHETMSFNCDPNFYDEDRLFALVKGPAACTKRCLYHKTLS
jgi:hypothetical protein